MRKIGPLPGERVARDGAFTSRRGPGEGLLQSPLSASTQSPRTKLTSTRESTGGGLAFSSLWRFRYFILTSFWAANFDF
jgi:hypothetical protein